MESSNNPRGFGNTPASRRTFLALGGAAIPAATLLGGESPAFADRPEPERPKSSPMKEPETELWYPDPAGDRFLQEALPIGNGRLGGLVGSDPAHDIYYITDGTLWTGGRNDSLDSDGQFPYEAKNFGSFNLLAKITVSLDGHSMKEVADYRRSLDLDNGMITVRYRKDGTTYKREVFASAPDDVIVIRMSSHGHGTLTGQVVAAGTHKEKTILGEASASFEGSFENGLKYATVVRLATMGGRIASSDNEVTFTDCRQVTIVISGGTDYAPKAERGFRNHQIDPRHLARKKADRAIQTSPEHLLYTHVADHRRLFQTMNISLGKSTEKQRSLDTWERLKARAKHDTPDPELESIYLQFGRYLTIASSRFGLPANLQGLWIDQNDPEWMSDYHTDINLQMNYWLAERAGLAECFDPMANYVLAQLPAWTSRTGKLFNDERNGFRNSTGKVAGWTTAISSNIYGGLGWQWHPAGNAWLANSLFTHYQYTKDRSYLRKIMPALKGACEFWEARLIWETVTDERSGKKRKVLVDDRDWSPEQGPKDAKGLTYAQELVWALFGNYVEASSTLGEDGEFAGRIARLRKRLYLPRVSPKSGKLEEWMDPDDLGEATHRHLSPLVGLFPGDRIRPDGSPKHLVNGAEKLLAARGMKSYGWGCAWRALAWARLKDAERAYRLVTTNLQPSTEGSNGTAKNFFDIYKLDASRSTFQIDSNFGTPAAMLEMLVYSRPGMIELLPALPKAWAESGSVTGVGARGGFVVDLKWSQGRLVYARIHSVGGRRTAVRTPSGTRHLVLRNGASATVH